MWNVFLLALGWKLREKWTIVQKYSHQIDYVIVAGAIVFIIWFIRKRRREMVRLPGSPDKVAAPDK
jgi:membrane protein DedA with SNARE-associated domain